MGNDDLLDRKAALLQCGEGVRTINDLRRGGLVLSTFEEALQRPLHLAQGVGLDHQDGDPGLLGLTTQAWLAPEPLSGAEEDIGIIERLNNTDRPVVTSRGLLDKLGGKTAAQNLQTLKGCGLLIVIGIGPIGGGWNRR